MSQKMVRIIAIVLAVVLAGGVLVVGFVNVFAADSDIDETGNMAVYTTNENGEIEAEGDLLLAPNPAAENDDNAQAAVLAATEVESPDTGTDGVPKAPIIIAAVAVVLAVACVLIPKFAKKK